MSKAYEIVESIGDELEASLNELLFTHANLRTPPWIVSLIVEDNIRVILNHLNKYAIIDKEALKDVIFLSKSRVSSCVYKIGVMIYAAIDKELTERCPEEMIRQELISRFINELENLEVKKENEQ